MRYIIDVDDLYGGGENGCGIVMLIITFILLMLNDTPLWETIVLLSWRLLRNFFSVVISSCHYCAAPNFKDGIADPIGSRYAYIPVRNVGIFRRITKLYRKIERK